MPLKLKSVKREVKGSKHFVARFDKDGKEIVRRFGTGSNYITAGSGKTDADRDAYRARHKAVAGANYRDATTPASLSMFLLWGESRSLSKNVSAYRKKYGV
jgi:hypothetical protein